MSSYFIYGLLINTIFEITLRKTIVTPEKYFLQVCFGLYHMCLSTFGTWPRPGANAKKQKSFFFLSWQASPRVINDVTLHFALQLWDTQPAVLRAPCAWFVPREVWDHLNVPEVYLTHQGGRDVEPLVAEYFQWFTCWAGPHRWAGLRVAVRQFSDPAPLSDADWNIGQFGQIFWKKAESGVSKGSRFSWVVERLSFQLFGALTVRTCPQPFTFKLLWVLSAIFGILGLWFPEGSRGILGKPMASESFGSLAVSGSTHCGVPTMASPERRYEVRSQHEPSTGPKRVFFLMSRVSLLIGANQEGAAYFNATGRNLLRTMRTAMELQMSWRHTRQLRIQVAEVPLWIHSGAMFVLCC